MNITALKSLELCEKKHVTSKIKESFVIDFAKKNNLRKKANTRQSIYLVDDEEVVICAYSNKFEVRQLPPEISTVICYNHAVKEWRFFTGDEIITQSQSRRSAATGEAGLQVTLVGGIVLS